MAAFINIPFRDLIGMRDYAGIMWRLWRIFKWTMLIIAITAVGYFASEYNIL